MYFCQPYKKIINNCTENNDLSLDTWKSDLWLRVLNTGLSQISPVLPILVSIQSAGNISLRHPEWQKRIYAEICVYSDFHSSAAIQIPGVIEVEKEFQNQITSKGRLIQSSLDEVFCWVKVTWLGFNFI